MLTEADSLKTMMKIDENTQTRTQIAFVCRVYAMFTNTNPPTYNHLIITSCGEQMYVTSGYGWKPASCPHMPRLLMDYE